MYFGILNLNFHSTDFHCDNISGETLQAFGNILKFETDQFNEFTQGISEQIAIDTTIEKDTINEMKGSHKAFYKLLDRYEETEAKIHQANKERAVSATNMDKLHEAEQTRELVKSRLKQVGHVLLLQQENVTKDIVTQMIKLVRDYLKCTHTYFSKGQTWFEQLQSSEPFASLDQEIENSREELLERSIQVAAKAAELGSDKRFDQIVIKKKPKRDDEHSSLVASKLPMIHLVSNEGGLEMVKTLLDSIPEDANSQDSQGWTPLHHACLRGHCEIAQEILQHGGNPNSLTGNGDTSLHLACSHGNLDCVELLLCQPGIMLNLLNK
jgi:hypothetical protein